MSAIVNQMAQFLCNAKMCGQVPTHWRMSFECFDAFRAEQMSTQNDLSLHLHQSGSPMFHDLPIYLDRDSSNAIPLLYTGPIPDELREAELHRAVCLIRAEAQAKAEPLMRELREIAGRKLIPPMTLSHQQIKELSRGAFDKLKPPR
jgi:hypothetical protein